MAVTEAEAQRGWETWVRREIGGSPPRIDAVMKIVSVAIAQKQSSEAIAALARQAAAIWDAAGSGRNGGDSDDRDHRPPTPPNVVMPPPAVEAPSHVAGESGYGIYDLVAADKSELGRATLAALNAIDLDIRLRTKAFLATRGFRGRYSFTHLSRSVVMPLTLLVLIGSIALIIVKEARLETVAGIAFCALIAELLLKLLVTPLLARRAELVIRHGRIMLTYGFFTTTPVVIEVHWIREVMWSQSFIQKLLGEASFLIHYDTPGRAVSVLTIPGLVRVRDKQAYVDKLRNASQKLRQGQGRYYSGGFVN